MDVFLLIFISLIVYIISLLIIKKSGWGRKKKCDNCNNCCPDCQSALNRVERKSTDRLLHHITFRIFDVRRYICSNCGWEGLRWEEKFQQRNN